MDSPRRFWIRILSHSHCELRDEVGGWSKVFVTVKGALDFVEGIPDAQVKITDGTGDHKMKVVFPALEPHRKKCGVVPRRESLLRVE